MNVLTWIGVVLLALWVVLWLVMKVVSGIVHVVMGAAVVLIVFGILKRGARKLREHRSST